MKICIVCATIFDNDTYEYCPFCDNNDLKEVKSLNVDNINNKFSGDFK